MQRRNFFKTSALAGMGIAGTSPLLGAFDPRPAQLPSQGKVIRPQIMAPRGAIYIPARAFNTWQQWKDYSEEETERDFGYAASINLNCLRIWMSYDYWVADSKRHEKCLEHMLGVADKKGIKVLLALFDSCGVENTKAAREDRNPTTAVAVKTPSTAISSNENRWSEPEKMVNQVMDIYGDDKRLLAIELVNEPGFAEHRIAMTRFLFKSAKARQGTIPLTVGSLRGMQNWGNFMDLGIDILQYHDNYPVHLKGFESELNMATQVAGVLGVPLWVTEWERLRPGGSGWDGKASGEELGPDYASLAPVVHQSGIGNCFWSLMLKPAYLAPQRRIGGFNGLFHEDGSVYSLADARAISGNPHFNAAEKKEKPDWWK